MNSINLQINSEKSKFKMSRSYKKPFGWVCGCKSRTMRFWKKKCNRRIRRASIELGQKSYYKKILGNDIWLSPSDGKWYYGEDPKFKRK